MTTKTPKGQSGALARDYNQATTSLWQGRSKNRKLKSFPIIGTFVTAFILVSVGILVSVACAPALFFSPPHIQKSSAEEDELKIRQKATGKVGEGGEQEEQEREHYNAAVSECVQKSLSPFILSTRRKKSKNKKHRSDCTGMNRVP